MSSPASPDPAQTCTRCCATIAADAPNGLCPACLMAEVMQPAQAAIVDEGSLPTMPVSRPSPSQPRNAVPDLPLPEELTALLPHGMYQVEGFLGQGGMGAVYKGTHVRLKRPVAIKIMHREAGRDYDFAQRFEREAQAMARLSHPNIVGVYDYGEAGPDYLYIVMELIDGADLMDVIRTGRMTQEMALMLLPQICDALQFAHDHSIVHRDIKPSNIMLTRDGRVKMCDFGLAKRYDVESSFRTQTGTGMGTPDYAAPEQFNANAQIDHRADIYALGVMIYQMITGELPRGVWKPPSQRAPVMPEWDDIVSHAMQSDPADRYQQASEVKTDVSKITPSCRASVSDAKSAKPSHRDGLQSGTSKSRAPLIFGLITGALVLAVGAFFALRGREDSVGLEPAPASPTASAPKSAQQLSTPVAKASGDGLKPRTTLAAATPAPIATTALPESGWQPLFTDAEWRAPVGPGREFRDGWLHLTGRMLKPRQLTRDSHIRTKVRIGPGLASPAIVLRDGAAEWRLELVADTQGKPVEFRLVKGTTGFAAPPTTVVSDKRETIFKNMTGTVVIELSISGNGLTAWARGQATQAGLRTVGAQFSKVSEWGISATDAWFESVEVQPLPAAAPPAPIAASALPESGWKPLVSKEEWETNWEGAPFNYGGKLVLPNRRFNKEGLLHMQSTSLYKPSPSPDGAIRVESVIRQLPHVINLGVRRRSGDQGRYAFGMAKNGNSLLMRYITTDATTWGTLQSCPLPTPLKIGDRLKLELRIQGSQLTGLWNGVAVLQAQDERLTAAGEWGLDVVDASIQSVEVQPLPAAVAGIKLWDTPEKLPKQKGVSWENGAVRVDKTVIATDSPAVRDLVFRASMKFGTDNGGGAHLLVRHQEKMHSYALALNGKVIELRLTQGGNARVLKSWPMPEKYQPEDWLRLEVKAIGPQLTVSVADQVLGTVEDSTLMATGGVSVGVVRTGYFKDIEYVPLDAPVISPSPSLPVSKSSDPAAIKLWDTPEKLPKQKGVNWEDGAVRLDSGSVNQPTPRSRDCIARVSVRMNPDAQRPELWLRKQSAINVGYKVGLNVQDRSVALKTMHTDIETVLMRWQLPHSYTPIEWVNLEFRAVGEDLTVSADGAVLGTLRDSSITQPGTMMLYGYAKSYFRNIEYIPLDASAVSPAPNLPVPARNASPARSASHSDAGGRSDAGGSASPPAFPPGKWVKPFTKPEDLPADLRKPGSGVTWEDGWIKGDGRKVLQIITAASNVGVRARVMRRVTGGEAKGGGVSGITLRNDPSKRYQLKLLDDRVLALRFKGPQTATGDTVLESSLGLPLLPAQEITLEFAAVGQRLITRTGDSVFRVTGGVDAKPGGVYISGTDAIRDIEVINLDGLPEAEALRLLGVDEQGNDVRGKTGAAEAWIDVLRDPSIVTLTKGAEFTPEGLRLPAGSGAYVARGKSLRGDVAMRVRTTFGGARLQLRSRSDGRGFYSLTVVDDKSVAIQRFDVAADKSTHLRTFTLPSPLKAGQDYEMEFRCVGPALTTSLNGEVLGTVTDETHTEGGCVLSAWETSQSTALAKAFSVLYLSKASASAASSSSVATATKDAPVTNTLGMKFVPVPITGGPTDKQRVLFSVWETRVQDYEVFVKETKREWPKAEFPQGPTHPAVNVSWEDAAAFCAWLTERERKAGKLGASEVYRLPSDHEWSCAVGIGTREDAAKLPAEKTQIQGVYPWGTPWPAPADAANVWSDELNPLVDAYKLNRPGEPPPRQDGHAFTAPVGSCTPSSLALHDLGGNVREWTADWYDGSRKQRVARGGAWAAADHGNLLSSLRMHFLAPNQQAKDIGFRMVLAPAAP